MDRPRNISSGEAMRWNADVERRRRAYHERRCAEDPIYRRAYERQREMMRRVQKMQSVAMTQLKNAMGEAEKRQPVPDNPVFQGDVVSINGKPYKYEEDKE